MKRFHVNLKVENLDSTVAFYSALFGAAPSVQKSDYAKWLLDEPALNFSVSQHADGRGIEHLGLQVDTDEELTILRNRAITAQAKLDHEGPTVCCYAKSDKTWVEDPEGISWELFRTYGQSDVNRSSEKESSCCAPSCCDTADA